MNWSVGWNGIGINWDWDTGFRMGLRPDPRVGSG